jgi:hypothetical protein
MDICAPKNILITGVLFPIMGFSKMGVDYPGGPGNRPK